MIVFRLAAPLLALCLAGPALADAKSSTSGSISLANCRAKAAMEYYQHLALCTDPYRWHDCTEKAALDYALAQSQCQAGSAAVASGTGQSAATGRLKMSAPLIPPPSLSGPDNSTGHDRPVLGRNRQSR